MLEIEENLKLLQELKIKLDNLEDSLSISSLKENLNILKQETEKEDFWNDRENSNKVFSRIKKIEKKINSYESILSTLENLIDMSNLLLVEYDTELSKELLNNSKDIAKQIENLELETLLSGKYDINNAIITLHPGAGGTESQDWAEMLYRMYGIWASSNGFTIKELDYLDGEEAGIKSVTFLVSGDYAYGYTKSEMGVHRLVRISPFDSGGRRHTSFASAEVLP